MARRISRRPTRPAAAILGFLALAFVVAPVAAARPPANDQLRKATAIAALPFAEALDTSGAKAANSDPVNTCVGNQGATVFYKFAPSGGAFVADTTGSDYDTVLTVYEATDAGLVHVACADDDNGTVQARLDFVLPEGTTSTYYIMVGAFANPGEVGRGGALAFSLSAGS